MSGRDEKGSSFSFDEHALDRVMHDMDVDSRDRRAGGQEGYDDFYSRPGAGNIDDGLPQLHQDVHHEQLGADNEHRPRSAAEVDAPEEAVFKRKSSDKQDSEQAKVGKTKLRLIIGGASFAGLIMLGGFGYVAMKVLSPNGGVPPASAGLMTDSQATGIASGNGVTDQAVNAFSSAINESSGASGFASANAVPFTGESSMNGAQAGSGASPLIVPFSANAAEDGVAIGSQVEQRLKDTLSAEEKIYDRLVDEAVAEGSGEKTPSMPQGLAGLEREFSETRKVISETQARMASIEKDLAKSIQGQEALGGQIMAISDAVKKLSAASASSGSADVEAIKQSLKRLEGRAAEAVKVAEEAKKIAAANQPRQPAAHQVQARPAAALKPVATAAPQPSIAQVVKATQPARTSGFPPHCDGRTVSANWRVKGVNANAAYVVRVQDGQGILVREGIEVPGFGRAQAFDAGSRTVCTTSGLIQR